MEKRIPQKNYIIVFFITVTTIITVLFLSNYYKVQQKYKEQRHPMLFLSEIKAEEFDNFIIENHDIMIYLINSENYEITLQNKIKEIITNSGFEKDIVVLDIKENEKIIEKLKNNYTVNNHLEIQENTLLFVKLGKIEKTFQVEINNTKDLKNKIEINFYGES